MYSIWGLRRSLDLLIGLARSSTPDCIWAVAEDRFSEVALSCLELASLAASLSDRTVDDHNHSGKSNVLHFTVVPSTFSYARRPLPFLAYCCYCT